MVLQGSWSDALEGCDAPIVQWERTPSAVPPTGAHYQLVVLAFVRINPLFLRRGLLRFWAIIGFLHWWSHLSSLKHLQVEMRYIIHFFILLLTLFLALRRALPVSDFDRARVSNRTQSAHYPPHYLPSLSLSSSFIARDAQRCFFPLPESPPY